MGNNFVKPGTQNNDLEPNWWQYAQTTSVLIQQFKKHVIPLLITGYLDNEFQFDIYTGFFLQSREFLIWLTAGHVVNSLTGLLANPRFRLKELVWLDGFPKKGGEAVRFHKPDINMKSWKDEGTDIGAIIPSLLDKENLLLNPNIQPVNSKIWLKLNQAQPEGYYAVGFPKSFWNHTCEEIVKGKKLHSIQPNYLCLPVNEISPPFEFADGPSWNDSEAFYGKITPYIDVPEFDLDHAKGMSGGPILSIERNPKGQMIYRLVGIVQSFDWSHSVIRAEPISRISNLVEEWINELLGENSSHV